MECARKEDINRMLEIEAEAKQTIKELTEENEE